MEPVRYEWDEAKRVENLEKHGIDFMAVRHFDWDTAAIFEDRSSRPTAEERIVAFASDRRAALRCSSTRVRGETSQDHQPQKGQPP